MLISSIKRTRNSLHSGEFEKEEINPNIEESTGSEHMSRARRRTDRQTWRCYDNNREMRLEEEVEAARLDSIDIGAGALDVGGSSPTPMADDVHGAGSIRW